MKILLISYYFPPFNAVGAVRTGKFAKYLTLAGHDVRVLTAGNQPWLADLPVEMNEQHIIRTSWWDINKPVQLLLGGKKSVAVKGFERAGQLPNVLKKLGYLYKNFINFPDGQIGWYPFGLYAGKKLLKGWQPEIILSSFSPPTSLLLAKKLARIANVPWVADLRDLWSDNHNADIYSSALRHRIDKKIEKWVLSDAHGLITVSEPLADVLKKKFTQPIDVVMNGYDLEDYPAHKKNDQTILRIVYTGIIHPVKRDPSALFKAISLLGKDQQKIKVDFYGRSNAIIRTIAREYGVEECVSCYDTVSYHESLQLQVNADLLLLLTYNADKEKGVITTKFFEYLGAKRPIILIGCIDGEAAKLIKERNVGLASNEPGEIVQLLQKIIREKEQGQVSPINAESIRGFSRCDQTQKLVSFLNHVVSDVTAN